MHKMQKSSTILLTLMVVVAVLCAALLPCAFIGAGSGNNIALAADYYAPITATSGKELLGQVHDLITSTHTKYTTYTDCKTPSYITQTDPGSKSGTVMDFYSQSDLPSTWNGNNAGTWNREHVWCQSLSNSMWGESGGGSDLHHIRPVEVRLNSARGNNLFGLVSNRESYKTYPKDSNGNYVTSALAGYNHGGVFEPKEEVKGDVARIVLYVYVHYNSYRNEMFGGYATKNGSGSPNYFGSLPIRNIIKANTDEAAFQLLMQWNETDPVDDIERTRNEAVYKIQGNRNPFVDHPEYVSAIWGDANGGGNGGGEDVPKNTLTLDKTSLVLRVGETANLTATTTIGTVDQLVWKSSDTTVASVLAGGVKANKVGTAIISVSNGTHTLQCTVTVVSGTPAEFSQIVQNLPNCNTLEDKFNSIKAALTIYNILTASEKQSVAADYQTLLLEISNYNQSADQINNEVNSAILAAVTAMSAFVVAFKLIYALLVNKTL